MLAPEKFLLVCDVWASQVDFCGAYIWFGPHQLNVFSRALALQCDLSQMKPGIKFGVRSCVQSPDDTLQFMLQTMPLGLVTVVFTPSDPLKGVTVRCNLTASPSKHPMPGLCCLCFSVPFSFTVCNENDCTFAFCTSIDVIDGGFCQDARNMERIFGGCVLRAWGRNKDTVGIGNLKWRSQNRPPPVTAQVIFGEEGGNWDEHATRPRAGLSVSESAWPFCPVIQRPFFLRLFSTLPRRRAGRPKPGERYARYVERHADGGGAELPGRGGRRHAVLFHRDVRHTGWGACPAALWGFLGQKGLGRSSFQSPFFLTTTPSWLQHCTVNSPLRDPNPGQKNGV